MKKKPVNCNHPQNLYSGIGWNCKAVNKSDNDCTCRWCTFNREFLKANGNG